MPRKAKAYVDEITNAIEKIHSFTKNMNFDKYVNDEKTKAAVERKLLTIGEALNQMGKLKSDVENIITDFKKIIAFRNILVHDYFVIDDQLVWDVIKNKINRLKKEIQKI